jgi:DNA modification methylase
MIVIHGATERRDTASLVPYARNSRTHSEEQIAQIVAAMREFGFTNPVIVDEAGGIVAGHGRIMAASRLGMPEVPVVVVRGWSEAQKRAYVIADNKLALNAGWDEARLAEELAGLQEVGFSFDAMGFDDAEVLELLTPKAAKSGRTDPDAVPPAPAPAQTVTRVGDVWLCGPHRVMCGDSTVPAAVAQLMGGSLADLLLTDPPYNVAYEGGTAAALKIENDSMSNTAFRAFLTAAFGAALGVMRPGAVFYVWHADSEGVNFRGACQDVGLRVQLCLIWEKQSLVLGRQDYQWKHEPCLYGWREGESHTWAGDARQSTVLEFDRPQRNGEHPTMKPVALFEYQLMNSTGLDDVVLDLFGGSGTTLIAAEKNERRARLMELSPVYADVIVSRWQAYTGQEAVHEGTGRAWGDLREVRLGLVDLEAVGQGAAA